MKTNALERCRGKLLSSEDDIKDLSSEFETERQDYLDTIRRQDRTIQLYEQLLNTVTPLIRRDCNYFNMDKIKDDCKWDNEAGRWILPKVTTTNITIVGLGESPNSSSGGQRMKPPALNASGSDGSLKGARVPSPSAKGVNGFLSSQDRFEEDKYLSYLQKTDGSSEYFKPKRALEILNKFHPLTKESSPISLHKGFDTMSTSSEDSNIMPNAAAVHGVDANTLGHMRPGKKLQSLTVSPVIPPSGSFEKGLEKLDKKKKKQHSLEPLHDVKLKKSM